jgi:hypothetical protein
MELSTPLTCDFLLAIAPLNWCLKRLQLILLIARKIDYFSASIRKYLIIGSRLDTKNTPAPSEASHDKRGGEDVGYRQSYVITPKITALTLFW